jgi:hypothetical protein
MLVWRKAAQVLSIGLVSSLTSGCAVPLERACPRCQTFSLGVRPPVPAGTKTVYLLIPGLLGYGWEWDDAQRELALLPESATLVWPWDPWLSVARSGDSLAAHINYLVQRLPRSVDRVVVVAHSAAGLLLLWAGARITVPSPLAVELISVGAPLAGQGFNPWGGQDLFRTPLPIALGSRFSSWPVLARGVSLRVFVTGPSDPVMASHFGHQPGDRRVLPPSTTVVELPVTLDHNVALGFVAKQFRAEAQARAAKSTSPP